MRMLQVTEGGAYICSPLTHHLPSLRLNFAARSSLPTSSGPSNGALPPLSHDPRCGTILAHCPQVVPCLLSRSWQKDVPSLAVLAERRAFFRGRHRKPCLLLRPSQKTLPSLAALTKNPAFSRGPLRKRCLLSRSS